MSADGTSLGLRERKKASTRESIVETANKLFVEEGFDDVTLERVAGECQVSVRTVLRYFDSKEDIALAYRAEILDRFKRELRDRSGDALSFWREHVAASAALSAVRPRALRAHLKMVLNHPALAARDAALRHEYEDLLAEALAQETGDEGLGPRLLAAMLVAGNYAVTRRWLAGHDPYDPADQLAVIDFAAAAAAHGSNNS